MRLTEMQLGHKRFSTRSTDDPTRTQLVIEEVTERVPFPGSSSVMLPKFTDSDILGTFRTRVARRLAIEGNDIFERTGILPGLGDLPSRNDTW